MGIPFISTSGIRLLVISFFILTIISCASRQEKAHRYFENNSGELAKLCDDKFPNDTIEIIEGETKVVIDTIYTNNIIKIPCPPNEPGSTETIYVECPPEKVIIETREKTDTIMFSDTRKIKSLEYQLGEKMKELIVKETQNNILHKDLKEAEKDRDKYKWILILLIVVYLGSTAIKLFKKFS